MGCNCGCCDLVGEDTVRFILLGFVLGLYLLGGAALFQLLEGETEILQAQQLNIVLNEFKEHYYELAGDEGPARLQRLLDTWGNASSTGLITSGRHWDFAGSFHFAATIVSTIGYGRTTPQTKPGKAAVILYGFIGCSGGILFFNLFLERIITFLAWMLRTWHLNRLKKRLKGTTLGQKRATKNQVLPDILDEEDDSLDHWKPSVYWVMLYLTAASCVCAAIAATIYSSMENWSYFESLYFCFVSFATIGFGDYVSTQMDSYSYEYAYRTANFIFILFGCCCIYSLLNVTSIVIKRTLNWIINKLTCKNYDPTSKFWRKQSFNRSSRRRSSRRPRVPTVYTSKPQDSNHNKTDKLEHDIESTSIGYDSDGEGRSGELISITELLKSNKVSLAVMQKQLYETAQMQYGGETNLNINGNTSSHGHQHSHARSSNSHSHNSGSHAHGHSKESHAHDNGFTPGTVGPLAIACHKLGDKKSSHRK